MTSNNQRRMCYVGSSPQHMVVKERGAVQPPPSVSVTHPFPAQKHNTPQPPPTSSLTAARQRRLCSFAYLLDVSSAPLSQRIGGSTLVNPQVLTHPAAYQSSPPSRQEQCLFCSAESADCSGRGHGAAARQQLSRTPTTTGAQHAAAAARLLARRRHRRAKECLCDHPA